MQSIQRNQNKQFKEIENTIERQERIKEHEKDKKQELKGLLSEYINNYFENNVSYTGESPEDCKKFFKLLYNRNYIINKIGENDNEYTFLDNIYDGVLNKIYTKFKNDYIVKWERLSREDKERIRSVNMKKSDTKYNEYMRQKSLAPPSSLEKQFFQSVEKSNKRLYKEKKETKKGFFEILINLILGG